MSQHPPPRILCVCLGNICRSPLAETLVRREAQAHGIEVVVDSAGTSAWHVGEFADPRAREVGEARGCRMEMRARQATARDMESFDLILAMDYANLRELMRFETADPDRIRLLRSYDPNADDDELPDPYYGGIEEFEAVADKIEATLPGLLKEIRRLPRR